MGYFIETKGCLKKVTEILKKNMEEKERRGWLEKRREEAWKMGEGGRGEIETK